MKTKYLLFSLALTAGFAACTSEFEQFETSVNQGQVALNDRATGKVVLSASRGNSDDTRIVAGDYNEEKGTFKWYWEEGDMIGGVLVDASNRGYAVNAIDGYGFTNHPYTSDVEGTAEKANFTSNTVVSEGVYVFYNAFEPQKTNRGPIENVLDDAVRIVAGATDETGLAQVGTNREKGGQNLFISPAVDMSLEWTDGKSENYVPITMQSVYHVLQLKLVADVGNFIGDFGINKIVVKPQNTTDFKKKFVLNPAELAAVGEAVKTEYLNEDRQDPRQHWFGGNGVILTKYNNQFDANIVRGLMEDVVAKMATSYNINGSKETCDKLVYYFDETEKFENDTDPKFIQVLIPGGEHGKLTVEVYTTEGVWSKSFEVDAENKKGYKGEYRYGNSTMMTGKMTIATGAATDVIKYNYTTDGFDIETSTDYKFALDYIAAHPTDFDKDHAPKFNLKNSEPLELSKFPDFKAKFYNKTKKATIRLTDDLTFNPELTVFDASETPILEVATGKTLTINTKISTSLNVIGQKDANGVATGTVNVTNSTVNAMTVGFEGMEIGALTIDGKSNVTISSEATIGTLTVAEAATVKITGDANLMNATLNGVSAFEAELTTGDSETPAESVIIAKDATVTGAWTNNAGVTVSAPVTAKTTLANNGTIAVNEGGKLNATTSITNGKEITVAMGAELTTKTLNNNGTFTLSGAGESATGEAYANITNKLNNNGTVNIEAAVSPYKTAIGGVMNVKGLANNASANVNNNGQFKVESGDNKGTITLGESDFAQIVLPALTGNGIVRLAAAENYPAPATTTLTNSINGANMVYAEFSTQSAYDEVKGYKGLDGAWEIIKVVEIAGNIDIAKGLTASNKEYHLVDNGVVTLSDADATLPNLTVKGSNCVVASKSTSGKKLRIEGVVTVDEKATLTVNKEVTMWLNSAKNPALLVKGNLINNGYLDAVQADLVTNIYANIAAGASLVNKNKIATNNGGALFTTSELDTFCNKLSKYLKRTGVVADRAATYKGVGSDGKTGPRFIVFPDAVKSDGTTNLNTCVNTDDHITLTAEEIYTQLFKESTTKKAVTSGGGSYWGVLDLGKMKINGVDKYVVFYPGAGNPETAYGSKDAAIATTSEVGTLVSILTEMKAEKKTLGSVNYMTSEYAYGDKTVPNKGTWFIFDNFGCLDISGHVWTYGEIDESSTVTSSFKGKFGKK